MRPRTGEKQRPNAGPFLPRPAARLSAQALRELLQDDDVFGFIVMDGNGSLYGTVCGNTRTVLHKFSVELPKKHGRGGQSSMRFARLRLEKRHNYVRKVAEQAVTQFITNDVPNVKGLVLAGSAEFKNQLMSSDLLDGRLKKIVLKLVDTSYGGENGFNQAIELAADALSNVKFVQEKRLISQFFDEISQDTGKYCFGVKDTLTVSGRFLRVVVVVCMCACVSMCVSPDPSPPSSPPRRWRCRRSRR